MRKILFMLACVLATVSMSAQVTDYGDTMSSYDRYTRQLQPKADTFNKQFGSDYSPELNWARYSSWQEDKAGRSKLVACGLAVATSICSVASVNATMKDSYTTAPVIIMFTSMLGTATVIYTIKGTVESSRARRARYVHDFR